MTFGETADFGARALVALLLAAAGCGSDDGSEQDDGTQGTVSDAGTGPGTSSTSGTTEASTTDTTATSDTDTGGPMSACTADQECDDGNICNGEESCSPDNVCQAGDPPVDATSCGDGMVCFEGECFSATCGNGVIEAGEQCDDGNLDTFDGCDAACYFEVFYRVYELTLMPSPAASFCDRPDSALGDSLSAFALESDNATRKADIDTGVYNGMIQLVALDDTSGMTDETIEFRAATGVPDPAGGAFPTDGSNPIDWPFLLDTKSTAPDGGFGERISDVQLASGTFLGGGGINMAVLPHFLDGAIRASFDYDPAPDPPPGPPAELAEGLVVPLELLADGDDEGVCGNLTVASMAADPASGTLVDCLECPGLSHTYTPCTGDVVDDTCNSGLDAIVGGCILGATCASGFQVVIPTQPDVDQGGPGPLVNDPNSLNKIPAAMTDGNLNGYSAYFRFRARRAKITGTE